jgi:hypothetical protein
VPDYWSSFWDILWWCLTVFVFVAYLMALFSIIADLFSDRELSGLGKAVWLIGLVILPLLTAVAYLIFRGADMAERSVRGQPVARTGVGEHARPMSGGPAAEIAQAKELLDSGAITGDEFATIKAGALARA